MKRHRTFTHEQDIEIRAKNLGGMSITSLSLAYDVGRKSIENAINRAGGAKDRTGSYTFLVEESKALRARVEAGETVLDISDELGVDRATISRAIKSVGGELHAGAPRRVDAYVSKDGYRRVLIGPDDPMFSMSSRHGGGDRRTVLEHRLVLARKLGRTLLSTETVHHKNGNPSDNREENLELRVGRHGRGATESHCATCKCFC